MPNAWESAPVVEGSKQVAPAAAWQSAPKVDATAPASNEPKRAFGDLFKSADEKPGQVSMPDYMMDQAARAPFKLLDFIEHGMSAQHVKFDELPEAFQKKYLAEHNGEKPKDAEYLNWGSKLAEKVLGKEPEAADWKQGLAGAGAGAALTGGGGSGKTAIETLKSMAASGALGATQEGASRILVNMGMSRENADKIVLMLGIGAGAAVAKAKTGIGKDAAERTAVDKTKDYVEQRDTVNQTATDKANPADAQAALAAAGKEKQAAFEARDKAAESIQKSADKHVENTIATFQPNSSLGDVAQGSLSKLNDTVRDTVKAQAQGTLQKVTQTQRVDAGPALALARKIEKEFAGRNAVSDSAGGVAANILSNTKENLGKNTDAPVGSGKISSGIKNKITTDTATLDGKTAHNIIGDINDRIEGKGKYAQENTPDVKNLLAVKKALIESIDKSSGGAYSKYLDDYAQGMSKLDPFQRGLAADKVIADLDYGRSKKMGPGEASETLLPKGAKGGDVATRIQTLMKDDPEFQQSVKSFVGQKLSDLKASPGGLTPQKFAAFQRDYGPAMKAYGIDKSLATVQDAVQAAAVREGELTAMRKATQTQRDQYASSALAKAAGVSDASMVLDPIMQGDRSSRLTNMRQAVQAIQKSPQAAAALDGMRSKFNQYFFDHPGESEDLALMAQKSGLYTPEQSANIRKVADSIRGENAQQQAQRMIRGAPTLENSSSVANYIVRKVGFIALSSGIGTIAGGPVAGAATGGLALAGQQLIARQKQMTVDAIAKIIEDPKMAKIMASKPDKANAYIADQVARQIAAQVAAHNSNQQDQQP